MSDSTKRRALLLILDGAGYSEDPTGNAVTPATLPRLFEHMRLHGHAVLGAAAEAVGLEAGQVGNSEAGHLTIGAGRVVPCMSRRILEEHASGAWAAQPGWGIARDAGVLHVVGLASDAGVHALARTLVHAAETASRAGVPRIVVHPVLDGVDSLAGSAPAVLSEVRAGLAAVPGVEEGVVLGRKWFCDRGGKLEVTRVFVDALGTDELPAFTDGALVAHLAGSASEMDFPPHALGSRRLRKGEPVLLTSHRADRARQAAQVLSADHPVLMLVDPGKGIDVHTVFFPQAPLDGGLAHELRRAGLSSVRIAEKCKFPHVTFFLNGFDAGVEGEGVCIPSIPEAEIPAKPEMSLAEVTDRICVALAEPGRRAVVANLANLDQVGHLGRADLAGRAAAEVDAAFERIARTCTEHGWTLFVTADHGNADKVEDADGRSFGSHTERPVPFLVQAAPGLAARWVAREGSLANVASTYLGALGLEAPDWMEPPLVELEPA